MDRKDELKERLGEPKTEPGGREAERDARRTEPPRDVRQHRLEDDEPGHPATTDEPASLGEQDHAAERVARRGPPRPGDDEKPR